MRRRQAGHRRLWDAGAQNERTALAWTRSTLALVGAALIVARIAFGPYPALGLSLAAGALILGTWVLLTARKRYRGAASSLSTNRPLPDARLPAAICLLTVLIGIVGVVLALRTG